MQHVESWFPDQKLNPMPLVFAAWVLTTGLPGKSQPHIFRLCVVACISKAFLLHFQILSNYMDILYSNCLFMKVKKVLVAQCVWLFVTPWTVACQPLLSMEFSRQEHWKGLPFPSAEDLPNPGIGPGSTCIGGRFFTIWATRETWILSYYMDILYSDCLFIFDRYFIFSKSRLLWKILLQTFICACFCMNACFIFIGNIHCWDIWKFCV